MTAPNPTGVGNPADRWYQGDGIRVHGLDWGGPPDGPLILLLHGFGGNALIWSDVAPLLRTELPMHRVVGLDGRDGGDTEHPAMGYERDRFVADVLAVHDALGGQPMVVVAHSRAGWLAAWLAARYPERVAALVLVDPARLALQADAANGAPAERSGRLVGASDPIYTMVREALGPFDSEAAALAWARAADPEAIWTETRTSSFLATLRPTEDGRLVGKLPVAAIDQLRAAREDSDAVAAAVRTVRAPTLLLLATRQSAARIAAKGLYADLIPGTEVRRIVGSHYLQTDAPAETAAAIVGFLRAHG